MAAAGQAKEAPFAGPRVKARSAGTGTLSSGRASWTGITSPDGHPDCWYCSWAYRAGRMEIKYLNSMCPARAHRPTVANVTSQGGDDE